MAGSVWSSSPRTLSFPLVMEEGRGVLDDLATLLTSHCYPTAQTVLSLAIVVTVGCTLDKVLADLLVSVFALMKFDITI